VPLIERAAAPFGTAIVRHARRCGAPFFGPARRISPVVVMPILAAAALGNAFGQRQPRCLGRQKALAPAADCRRACSAGSDDHDRVPGPARAAFRLVLFLILGVGLRLNEHAGKASAGRLAEASSIHITTRTPSHIAAQVTVLRDLRGPQPSGRTPRTAAVRPAGLCWSWGRIAARLPPHPLPRCKVP